MFKQLNFITGFDDFLPITVLNAVNKAVKDISYYVHVPKINIGVVEYYNCTDMTSITVRDLFVDQG